VNEKPHELVIKRTKEIYDKFRMITYRFRCVMPFSRTESVPAIKYPLLPSIAIIRNFYDDSDNNQTGKAGATSKKKIRQLIHPLAVGGDGGLGGSGPSPPERFAGSAVTTARAPYLRHYRP